MLFRFQSYLFSPRVVGWLPLCLFGLMVMPQLPAAEDNTIEESFLNGQLNRMQFGVVGNNSMIEPETEGLRIKAAEPTDQNVGLQIPHLVHGDFEFSLDAVLNDTTAPTDGYGTGLAMLMEDGVRFGASLQLVVLPDGKPSIVTHHFKIVAGEHQHQAKTFPAVTSHAVLRLKRTGEKLIYQVSTDAGTTFRDLHQIDFSDRPLRVTQAYAQAGGASNTFDVSFRSLRLTAEELVRPGQKPKSDSSRQLITVIIIGVLGVLGTLAAGIVILRNRRPAAEHVS